MQVRSGAAACAGHELEGCSQSHQEAARRHSRKIHLLGEIRVLTRGGFRGVRRAGKSVRKGRTDGRRCGDVFRSGRQFFRSRKSRRHRGRRFHPGRRENLSRPAYRHGRPGESHGQDLLLGRALFPELERARNAGNGTECICRIQAPLAGKVPRVKVRFPGKYRAGFAAGRPAAGEEAPQNRGAGYNELLDRALERGTA